MMIADWAVRQRGPRLGGGDRRERQTRSVENVYGVCDFSMSAALQRAFVLGMILSAAGAHAAERSPGTAFRGARGSAVYDVPGLPTSWSEAHHQNIRWKADLAVPGWASPVIWKDKVIVTGADSEHRYAWCFSEADGKRV